MPLRYHNRYPDLKCRYPIVYLVLIMPLTIVRWIGFKKEINTDKSYHTPIATLTAMIIFSMGGVFDALLFFLTRKGLFAPDSRRAPRAPAINLMRTAEGRSSR
jgi:hypothetical protein